MFPLEQTSISRTIDLALIIFNHKGHRFLLIVLAVSEWRAPNKTECGSLRSSVDLTGHGKRPRRPGGLSNAARTDRLARVRQSTGGHSRHLGLVTAADLGSAIRALAIADIIQAKGQMASAPPISDGTPRVPPISTKIGFVRV